MELHRFAIVNVDASKKQLETAVLLYLQLKNCKTSIVDIYELETKTEAEEKSTIRALILAETKINKHDLKEINSEIEIPDSILRNCHRSIEMLAHAISACLSVRIDIFSPVDCIRLIPKTRRERQLLERCHTYIKKESTSNTSTLKKTLSPDILNQLSDRLDGLALLSEALSGGNAASKFRDLIRVFELAFKSKIYDLDKRIFDFSDEKIGLTREEVREWKRNRDPISHADMLRSHKISFSSDVEKYIHKMELTARDVVFNKKTWQDKNIERRELLDVKPAANDGVILRINTGLDEFQAFKGLFNNLRLPGWPYDHPKNIETRRLGKEQLNRLLEREKEQNDAEIRENENKDKS